VEVQSLRAWIESAYGVRRATLYEAIQTLQREVYASDSAPPSLDHRYLTEDVPCGAVPVADLGRQLGVDVSLTTHCVGLACALLQRDFWASGRTARRLGLEGLSPEQIRQRVA
jgi:opine dehydrogenase